jgi:hypothetical protein
MHPTQVLGASDALTLLLTVESLLITALAVAVSLTGSHSEGSAPFVVRGGLAAVIAASVTIVAVGAAAAWIVVYIDPTPVGVAQWAEAIGIGVGVLAEPVFAWGLWAATR